MTAWGWIGILFLALLAGLGVLGFIRWEDRAPTVQAPDALVVNAAGREVELVFDDEGSGLQSIRVVLAHARGEVVLSEEDVPGSLWSGSAAIGPRRVAIRIDPKKQGLPDGDAFLRISARDWSWRDGLRGNETRVEVPLRVDRKPPRVGVESGLTYVKRGGSGSVVYRVSEAAVRDGVEVGDAFYPGFSLGNRRIAIFAVPTDAAANPTVRVVAEDAAGNSAQAEWPVVVKERAFPEAQISLQQRFLETKTRQLAEAQGIDTSDLSAAFREINTDLRLANEARIREILSGSAPEPMWSGGFEQLRNSQVTSRFAEHRRYFVDGRKNSEAIHYGYDLASIAAAPITASAAGRVVYADDLGIYGNCVLIDHGVGVSSLYGHLSRMDVSKGDVVEQGQQLGLSGATGLAGGDHLHFAILVGKTYVDPLEWWDGEWVRTHVEERLGIAGPSRPQTEGDESAAEQAF